ncbi:MAG: hypothetical protein KAI43_09080 [Candidatus Aureabacteria bacterium]|nr:hypothetical protein [Candidatus Auribacterota bacterium]
MKRLFLLVLFTVFISSGCAVDVVRTSNASVSRVGTGIKRVAVLDFEFDRAETDEIALGKANRPRNAGAIMADIFMEQLMDTGRYDFVERRQVKRLLDERGLSVSGILEKKSLDEIGKMLNVDALVVGVVSDFSDYNTGLIWGACAAFSARMVDINSGLVVWSVSANRNINFTNVTSAAQMVSKDAVKQLLKKLKSKKNRKK